MEDRSFSPYLVLICRICWLKNCPMSFYGVPALLLWTCMMFQSCCILSLQSFIFCNLYFEMQNLKDYFGYAHACLMFRMLISTKKCWVWKEKACLSPMSDIFYLTLIYDWSFSLYFHPLDAHNVCNSKLLINIYY